LKFAAADGQVIASVELRDPRTMLVPEPEILGDVMGVASAALERDLRVPVLFVNGLSAT
jgi:hypothetical protein